MKGGIKHDCASILDSIASFHLIYRMRIPTAPFSQLNDF